MMVQKLWVQNYQGSLDTHSSVLSPLHSGKSLIYIQEVEVKFHPSIGYLVYPWMRYFLLLWNFVSAEVKTKVRSEQ